MPLDVKLPLLFLLTLLLPCGAAAAPPHEPHEPHQRLDTSSPAHARDVALTLDACGGTYDRDVITTLVRLKVPATIFVTRRWLDANPGATRELIAHPELFELENHGSAHVPAVVGGSVFGMRGSRDVAGVEKEVLGGAQAISRAASQPTTWFRGAGAAYDSQGEQCIARLGYQIAGFSLNADDGATLGEAAVARRLRRVQPGDIVIAHMNKPASGTAEGIAAALPELLARNYRFVKLSQAAGVQPVDNSQPKR
jgi:peptidoglycan/xylan/chitin deacetylase (PgdA/CDA1 family)